MRLDQSQQLRLSQEMKLSPRMIQAMEILQLPMMALQERIEAEMESNPVLELAETTDEPADLDVDHDADRGERELVVEGENGEADFDRMDRMAAEYGEEVFDSDASSGRGSYNTAASDAKQGAMENSAARGESLNEYLHEQWTFVEADEAIHKAGSLIIEHIDDDGYIRTPLEELVELANRAVAASRQWEALQDTGDTPGATAGNGEPDTTTDFASDETMSDEHAAAPSASGELNLDRTVELDRQRGEAPAPTRPPAETDTRQHGRRAAAPRTTPGSPRTDNAAPRETSIETGTTPEACTDGTAPHNASPPSYSRGTFEQALRLVQTLDPTGVGARNLRECLLIQLNVKEVAGEDVALPKMLAGGYLREIETNQLPKIAKRSGMDIDEIKRGIEALSHLNPHPGHLIGDREVPTIEPDVYVDLDENGQAVVTMSEANVPALVINEYYRQAARDRRTDRDARQFLRKNIRSANWLISAIAQRRHTIRRVAEEVFKVQCDFLENGREALKPLPMADIAETVGVHVATVSRAVADKYALTPQGIVPLRMFFSGGTKTADGEDMSWDAVKAKLKDLVDNEDTSKPLSDKALAKALQAGGIDIARRTVAKYRDQLDIPTARKRKQY
ncbi:MAG: RNA polymerase factor sigma-54 [Planctomycetes bacterium]|nr:RNA polymerase factor sigma-54 [Planctomycetota bacterium]